MTLRTYPLLLALLGSLSVPTVFAAAIQPAVYDGTLLYSDSQGHQSFLRPNAAGTYTLGEETVTMGGTPSATVEGTGSSSAAAGGFGSTGSTGGGKVSYYFTFSGPSSVDLPIILATRLHIDLTGTSFNTGNALASVLLTGDSSGDIVKPQIDCNIQAACTTADFNGPVYAHIMSNTLYQIQVYASYQAQGGNTAHVLADPSISINSTAFSGDASQYTLLQSAGIGNDLSTGTPEPATFGTLAASAILALIARRRAVI